MKGKVKIHFLFYVVGVINLLSGRFYTFFIYALCDILHELGHSFVAGRFGVKLGEIMLMPYGAVVTNKTDGLKLKDDILIALGGPLINLSLATFFIACWWITPECYYFTMEIVTANISLAIINLIPAYSLDGGRILSDILQFWFSESVANRVVKTIAFLLSVIMLFFFIVSCFTLPNLSLLFFAVFLFSSIFVRQKGYRYIKISEFLQQNMHTGTKANVFVIDEKSTIKALLKNLNTNQFNRAVIYDGKNVVCSLDQWQIVDICKRSHIYSTIKESLIAFK